jgi:hypothetical protein
MKMGKQLRLFSIVLATAACLFAAYGQRPAYQTKTRAVSAPTTGVAGIYDVRAFGAKSKANYDYVFGKGAEARP